VGWELDWWEEWRQVGYLSGGIAPFSSEGEVLLALASMAPGTRRKDIRGTFLDDGLAMPPVHRRHKYTIDGWGPGVQQLELFADDLA
jgi:hypothetical protein